MSNFCHGTIVTDQDTAQFLSEVNIIPVPEGLVSNVPVNAKTIDTNSVDLGYSIISLNPNRLNDVITGKTGSLDNFKKVSLTKQIDSSLVANSTNPEFQPITKWEINTSPTLNYGKTVFAGADPYKNISNNKELWYQQIIGLEESINYFLIHTLYPNGYSSSRVSLNMGEYPIYEGNGNVQTARQEVTCFNLLRQFKAVSGEKLKTISKFENASCLNLNWTCYNKTTVGSVLESVEQIVNNPIVNAKTPGECGCEENPCDINKYFNSIDICSPDEPTGSQYFEGCTGESGYTAYYHNHNAETYYPFINNLPNNIVILKNTVYVDAFCENENLYDAAPYILQLDFYTEFYFQMAPKPILTDDTNGCSSSDIPWNPSPSVYVPERTVFTVPYLE